MKKTIYIWLCTAALLAGFMTACDEVHEVSEFDDWKNRNALYVDSLAAVAGSNVLVTEDDVNNAEVGKLYAIEVQSANTTKGKQYVYCKKLTSNPSGIRPTYRDYVSVYYYGTLMNGRRFDGNFTGYAATDKVVNGSERLPSPQDAYDTYAVSGSVIAAWTWSLMYMRTGERWMIFAPYQTAYGTRDNNGIKAYSTLVFDIILRDTFQ